ncbi:hypothetical protein F2Q69_00047170 [Brassica cretica]|uniref:Uncharacterized protein n=1 Tax=Brassica cretica TaxID=69181 RepID=A0A8S9PZL0_BRACR|nr:hypothetical protein F2Q69_00047170 [Brassica cretica]
MARMLDENDEEGMVWSKKRNVAGAACSGCYEIQMAWCCFIVHVRMVHFAFEGWILVNAINRMKLGHSSSLKDLERLGNPSRQASLFLFSLLLSRLSFSLSLRDLSLLSLLLAGAVWWWWWWLQLIGGGCQISLLSWFLVPDLFRSPLPCLLFPDLDPDLDLDLDLEQETRGMRSEQIWNKGTRERRNLVTTTNRLQPPPPPYGTGEEEGERERRRREREIHERRREKRKREA